MDIGRETRRYEFEPLDEPAPADEPAVEPAEPEPAPAEPEPQPA